MSETTTYTVTGMTCGHCAASVTEEISEIAGVEDVAVVVETGAVTVSRMTWATTASSSWPTPSARASSIPPQWPTIEPTGFAVITRENADQPDIVKFISSRRPQRVPDGSCPPGRVSSAVASSRRHLAVRP